jgi:hypothetical protein
MATLRRKKRGMRVIYTTVSSPINSIDGLDLAREVVSANRNTSAQ